MLIKSNHYPDHKVYTMLFQLANCNLNNKEADTVIRLFFQAVMKAECEAFRQLALPPTGYVISLTGSTPISPESRSHMRKLGKTIFLDVSADDIIKRYGPLKVNLIMFTVRTIYCFIPWMKRLLMKIFHTTCIDTSCLENFRYKFGSSSSFGKNCYLNLYSEF